MLHLEITSNYSVNIIVFGALLKKLLYELKNQERDPIFNLFPLS